MKDAVRARFRVRTTRSTPGLAERPRRRRVPGTGAAAVAVALAAVPAATLVSSAAGAAPTDGAPVAATTGAQAPAVGSTAATTTTAPAAGTTTSRGSSASTSATTATAATPAAPVVLDPTVDDPAFPAGDWAWSDSSRPSRSAQIIRPTRVRFAPRFSSRIRTSLAVLSPHMKDPVRLLVLERRIVEGRSWLRVLLPGRPNGRTGWVLATSSIVRTSAYIVRVHLNARRVDLIRGKKVLARYPVVVGARTTPTPTGRFAIYEIQRQRDASGFIGPVALHLTARSRVLDNYGGGPGTIALHGRGPAALGDPLGSARSHGCIRMQNRAVLHLSRLLKAGTPVVITKR